MKRSRLGSLDVTSLGLGSAPLGGLFTPVSDADAEATIAARLVARNPLLRHRAALRLWPRGATAWRLPAAPARASRTSSRPRSAVCCARPMALAAEDAHYKGTSRERPVFDFSYDGVMRSVEESLARLGLDRVDILHVHDPDDHYDDAVAGAFRALAALRAEGTIKAIGAGMNQSDMLVRFAARPFRSTASCSPAATRCSTRARWMRCSRSARAKTSASCSAASTTAASWPIRTRARSSTIRTPMRHWSPVRSRSTSFAASTAPS